MEEFMDLYGINLWFVYLELFNSRYHVKGISGRRVQKQVGGMTWKNFHIKDFHICIIQISEYVAVECTLKKLREDILHSYVFNCNTRAKDVQTIQISNRKDKTYHI